MSASAGWRAQGLGPRVLSAAVLAPIAVAAVWYGGLALAGFMFVFLLVGLGEFYLMARRAGIPAQIVPGLVTGAALILLAFQHQTESLGVILLAAAIWTLGMSLAPPLEGRVAGAAVTWFGLAYVVGLGVHVLWLRELPHGAELLLLVVAVTWASDIGAFFVGVRWGRTRFAPHVSPGKTVEGVVGGLVTAALVGAGVATLVVPDQLGPFQGMLLGVMAGLAAPMGDLFESMIKRNFGAKDSSRIIPGHGGVLDRVDSLLLTAPISYYLLRFLLGEA